VEKNIKKNILISLFWAFFGQGGYLIVGLIANIILTRLLSPYEFGQVGIVMFFIVLAKVLTESGLSGAVIRKTEVNEDDYSTVFVFNLVVSIILMVILISLSKTISMIYNDETLQYIIVAASSILFINAFQITQNIKLIRNFNFKKKAIYEFISISISSLIGIFLALKNFGVWSIVVMQISTAIILTSILWFKEGALKSVKFNKNSFKGLYKFGLNTTLASLLNTFFDNIYQLILGKYFSITETGLYFQGKKLQEIPIGVVNSVSQSVIFSSLSKFQNNINEFNIFYNKIIRVFTVLVGFMCLIIFFYAENIIVTLYGIEWINSAFYMKVLIICSYFYLQEMFNRVVFKVFNKTNKILYLEVIKKIIQSVSIVIGLFFNDISILLYGYILTSILSFLFNYYEARKLKQDFSNVEILIVFKVVLICAFTYFLSDYFLTKFTFINIYSIILLPFMFIAYFGFIYIMNILNIKYELSNIISLIKKSH